ARGRRRCYGSFGSRPELLTAAARRLDLGAGRLAEPVGRNLERLADLPVAQHLDRLALAHEAEIREEVGRDVGGELGELRQVDHRVLGLEDVGEAALRDAADERHLAALEAGPRAGAGARLLPLLTASRRLADPRARPAADALPGVLAPLGRRQLVQLHDLSS